MNNDISSVSTLSAKFMTVVGIGLVLIGCSPATPPLPTLAPTPGAAVTTPGAATPANIASSTESTVGQPIAAGPAIKDACTILTASAIKSILGIEFGEGASKPSFTQGS